MKPQQGDQINITQGRWVDALGKAAGGVCSALDVWIQNCSVLARLSRCKGLTPLTVPHLLQKTAFILAVPLQLLLYAEVSNSSMTPPVDGTLVWSNGYGAFNVPVPHNHMYHAGLDLGGTLGVTPIKAADSGTVKFIVGLAPHGGGAERIATWDDKNGNGIVDSGEISGLFSTGRPDQNNHGFGIAMIIDHGGQLYTLYGHLYAVKKEIYEAVVVNGGTFSVTKGQLIAVMGSSAYDCYTSGSDCPAPHVHFEAKSALTLESPRSDSSGPYWGYTPDLPTTYGYSDPLLSFNPSPTPSLITAAIKVINEEGGSSETDRGVRVYTGPGVNYSVLGWTGLNQIFVADATVLSTTPGDNISNRLWYRIYLPNRLGPTSGWVASQKSDGTPLVQQDTSGIVVQVVNDDGVGWRLRLDPSIDCNVTPSNCVRVWDNTYSGGQYRNVLAWNGLKFIRFATQIVSGVIWHGFYIPKFYFNDPQSTAKIAPAQDNVVGEVKTAWLTDGAISVLSGQTLSVSLTPNPATGNAPLSTDLSADVSGTATGTINYTFWWNCSNTGTSVSAVTTACGDPNNASIGAKFNGVTDDPKLVNHTYSTAGTYTAKVIAERGSAPPVESRATVTVTVGAPPAPALVSPTNGFVFSAGTTSVTLQWSNVSGATAYDVEVATGSCGGTPVTGVSLSAIFNSWNISPGPNPGVTYFWRVRAVNSVGPSLYSNCYSFSITDAAPPFSVAVVAPLTGEIISGAYPFKGIAADLSGTIQKIEFYIDSDISPACSDTTPKTSYSTFQCNWPTTTKPNGAHAVRAKAYDASNNSAFSSPVSFTINNTGLVGTLQFSLSSYSVNEGAANATVIVTRTGGSSGAVGVTLTTSNGTATAGSDYTAVSQTVSFANGDTASKTVSIPIVNDSLYEGDETVNLALSSPTGGATLGSPSTALLTIVDDDPPPAGSLQFSSSSFSVNENGGSATITVTRTGGSNGAVGVAFSTSNGTATAGSDYTAVSQTVSFASGDTANKTVNVPITNDSTYEGNETVNLTLSSPTGGATLGSPSTALLTIVDDDPVTLPTVNVTAITPIATESGLGQGRFSVLRNGGDVSSPLVVNYTVSGTATPGVDYQTLTGSVTIPAFFGSWEILVTPIDDTLAEPDESVTVTLTPDTAYTIGNPGSATVTIVDNDPPLASVSINDSQINEGNSGTTNAVFTVTLSSASSQTVTVSYSLSNGTATGGSSCTGSTDYISAGGILTFTPGATSKPINVAVCGDLAVEQNETFFVTLTSATNANIARGQGTGTIVNDDSPTVPYTSFQGETYSLYPWYGQKIVLLTLSGSLDPTAMQAIVAALDAAYGVYETITGREPTPWGPAVLNGRNTIAEVPDGHTCGAGCAYIGFTGIEIDSTRFGWLYDGYIQHGQYDQVPFYELGHNFWSYSSQLAALDPFVTGFAIANRFISMEVAGLPGAPFNQTLDFQTFKNSIVFDLLDSYLADDTLNWENTLKIGQAPPNPYGWSVGDLAGAMFYQIFHDNGSSGYHAFFEALALLPQANTATDAVNNFIKAAYDGTGRDYTYLFYPPQTVITSNPPAMSKSTSASFFFTSRGAASAFACSLDGAAFAACASPKSYTKLKAGSHNFQVRATGTIGSIDPTPASFDWTIDITAPNTTITSGPPVLTNNPVATFTFTSTEAGGSFQCSLDGGAFASCTSPFVSSPLADGKHAFQVKAVDVAGNVDKSAAKAKAWTVDATRPITTITGKPTDPTTSTTATFKFTSEKKSTFQCSLGGGALTPCKSGQKYSGLAKGSHNFQVQATDAAGNVELTPASYSWMQN